MTIHLRPATEADLPFVYGLEHAADNSPYLLPWPIERHQKALADPDIRHWIAEHTKTGQPVGYVILAGLAQSHDSIELMRITLAVKGKGYGREILRQIKQWAFPTRGRTASGWTSRRRMSAPFTCTNRKAFASRAPCANA